MCGIVAVVRRPDSGIAPDLAALIAALDEAGAGLAGLRDAPVADGLDHITAAMAVSPKAVYEVTDGLPISIVVLVLTPDDLVNEHLEFLSGLSLLLQSAQLRRQLQEAKTADQVLGAIRENERDSA